ncbi:PIN domain-containing protein [Dehalococcoidales bacterium]|nr:PIN domain-containing protein [Dehalococcoidales bacterium]
MAPAFLDANIILRYLLQDDELKAQRCLELLEKAERREVILHTTDLVIAETVWVLESPSTYNLPKDRIRDLLLPIILLPGLRLADKKLYRRIFDLYVNQDIDFIDAYNTAHMEKWGLMQVYSYDLDFDRISGITRLEP